MSFKKYNLLLGFLLGMLIITPILSTTLSEKESANGEGTVVEIPAAEISPGDTAVVESVGTMPNYGTTSSSIWQYYSYAYKLCYQGKGYTSITNQKVTAYSASTGIEFSKQSVSTKKQKNGNEELMMTASNGFMNFFMSAYTSGDGSIKTSNVDGNYSVSTPPSVGTTAMTKEQYLGLHAALPAALPHALSSKTATASGFNIRNGKISFSLTLKNSANTNYIREISTSSGSSTTPKITKCVLTFVINKATGQIESLTKSEEYEITVKGLSVNCKSSSTERFFSVGAGATIDTTFMR